MSLPLSLPRKLKTLFKLVQAHKISCAIQVFISPAPLPAPKTMVKALAEPGARTNLLGIITPERSFKSQVLLVKLVQKQRVPTVHLPKSEWFQLHFSPVSTGQPFSHVWPPARVSCQ